MCWVVPSVRGGGGGVKVEGKGKDGRVETTRPKNLGRIEFGGGLLLSGGLRYGNSNIIDFLFGM